VAHCGFLYLSMLKTQGPQQWVFDELRRAQDMSWRFLEETDPVEYVQKLACQMLPDLGRAPEHILKGDWMLSRWDPEAISQFLGRLAPEKCFLALVSSSFGQAQSSKAEGEEGEERGAPRDRPRAGHGEGPLLRLGGGRAPAARGLLRHGVLEGGEGGGADAAGTLAGELQWPSCGCGGISAAS
ncbi:unnamed protein product, partial [Effrenium voratum]